MPWFLCHGDIQIQFCTICRNHTSFSVPFNLAEVTSVSQFLSIMDTKIQFKIQVPVEPIYKIKMRSVILGVRSSLRSDQNENVFQSNYPNSSFWYEIRHLGGQIKHKEQINVPGYLYEIHCTCFCPVISLAKAQLTWASPSCSIPQQREPWCCCNDRGSPTWSPWGSRSGRPHEHSRPPPFSKESSTTC